MIINGYQVKS